MDWLVEKIKNPVRPRGSLSHRASLRRVVRVQRTASFVLCSEARHRATRALIHAPSVRHASAERGRGGADPP